jgi:hypothetical protein
MMFPLPVKGYVIRHSDGRISMASFSTDEARAWDGVALGERITSAEKARHLEAGVTVVPVELRQCAKIKRPAA